MAGKNIKRMLALFLTLTLCVTSSGLGQTVFAEETKGDGGTFAAQTEDVQEDKAGQTEEKPASDSGKEDLTEAEPGQEDGTAPSIEETKNPEEGTADTPQDTAEEEEPAQNPGQGETAPNPEEEGTEKEPEEETLPEDSPDESAEEELLLETFFSDEEEIELTATGSSTPELPHKKTIKKNQDGTYTLTLDVEGIQESQVAKPDVLIVLDTSGSMIYGIDKTTDVPPYTGDAANRAAIDATNENGSKSRISVAREYFSILLENLENSHSIRAVELIGFDNGTNTYPRYSWGNDVSAFKNVIPSYDALFQWYNNHKGTWWNAGLDLATSEMSTRINQDASTTRERYVIFVTDGEPNSGLELFPPSDVYNEAVREAKQLLLLPNIHLINVEVGTITGAYNLNKFHYEVGGEKWYCVQNEQNWSEMIAHVQKTIEQGIRYATNVTITDQLTDYVELAGGSWSASNPKCTLNGSSYAVPSKVKNSITYNASTKSVSMTIPELKPGEKYTLSFDIKPSQKAYDAYAGVDANGKKLSTSGYIDTGDTGTGDYAGQKGFYSNTRATVNYKFGGKTATLEYKKPVVQVELLQVPVTKTWNAGSGTIPTSSVQVGLYLNSQSSPFQTQYLRSSGSWKGTFTNVPPGHTYRVEEITSISGYESSVSPSSYTASQTASMEGTGFKVTNTNTKIGKLTIEKIVLGPDDGNYFNVDITLKDNNNRNYNGTLPYSNGLSSGSLSFNNGKATVSLKNGDIILITEIPLGYSYTVEEQAASSSGYEVVYSGSDKAGTFSATSFNKEIEIHNAKGWAVPVKKIWKWGSKKPESIEIQLYLFSGPYPVPYASVTLNEANDWRGMLYWDGGVTDDTLCCASETINWGTSAEPENYTSKIYTNYGHVTFDDVSNPQKFYLIKSFGILVENTESFDIPIQKVWRDNDDKTARPLSVVVDLYQNDNANPFKTIELSEQGGWRGTFSNIPAGYSYKVVERPVEGYVSEIASYLENGTSDVGLLKQGITITNTPVMDIPVVKKWVHDEDTELPESITLKLYQHTQSSLSSGPATLYREVVLDSSYADENDSDTWNYVFEDVPTGYYYYLTENYFTWEEVDSCSREIVYAADGKIVNPYVEFRNNVDELKQGFIVTNTERIKIPIKKEWICREGTTLPSSINATIYQDSKKYKDVTISASSGWETTCFVDVGHAYYVVENSVNIPEGFQTTCFPTSDGGGVRDIETLKRGFTITNLQKDGAGTLHITKKLSGAYADAEKTFYIELALYKPSAGIGYTGTADCTINGEKTTLNFTGGKDLICLKGGETADITGLPLDYSYTVREMPESSEEYRATYRDNNGRTQTENAQGTFTTSSYEQSVTVTNSLKTSTLSLSKRIKGGTVDGEKSFGITLYLSKTEDFSDKSFSGSFTAVNSSDGAEQTVNFTNGKLDINLKSGESLYIYNLPNNYYYKAEEDEDSKAGYIVTYEGETGRIGNSENMTGGIHSISVINEILYELPNSGGIGTYLFTLGGIAIMTTALLLFIKNKRKEDEEEKGYQRM